MVLYFFVYDFCNPDTCFFIYPGFFLDYMVILGGGSGFSDSHFCSLRMSVYMLVAWSYFSLVLDFEGERSLSWVESVLEFIMFVHEEIPSL